MAKSAKKPGVPQPQRRVSAAKPLPAGNRPKATKPTVVATELPVPGAKEKDSGRTAKTNNRASGTKQSRVLAMLHSSPGATIAAIIQATGWQQHSVRGFLAGVVRKRLKLKLISKKVDGSRVYEIAGGADAKATPREAKRRPA
jgi:hypothetical protein